MDQKYSEKIKKILQKFQKVKHSIYMYLQLFI